MHCTRLPFWTELRVWVLEEKRVADLRPEKPAFTEVASREEGAEDAAALKATGATTEEATADAIAGEMLE
jgi:hypothetical protein